MSLVGIFRPFFDLLCYLSLIGLQFVLSPTYCSAVQIRNDGKVKWNKLDYHLGDIETSMEDRELCKSFAFAMADDIYSTLCSSSRCVRAVLLNSCNGKCQLG